MAKKTRSTKKGGCWKGGKRRTRRVRGGAYGAGDAIAVGALEYKGVDTASPVNSATGVMTPDIYDVKSGGRRRKSRKSRKGSRKMRGGASQVSAMKAGYGFNGSGAGGLADAVPAPTSGGNAF